MRPTVGKFWTPSKPIVLELAQEDPHEPERVGPVDAGQHRHVPDDRQDLGGHLDDDPVRVAVGQQAGERAAAGHPVAARVVDDHQVGAAGLGHLGRDAGAGAAADDRDARPSIWARSRRVISARGMNGMSALLPDGWAAGSALAASIASRRSAMASAKAGSLMCRSSSTSSTSERSTVAPDRVEQGGVGLGCAERHPLGVDHAHALAAGGTAPIGPVAALSFAAMIPPSSALSSGVVRMSVTCGLCR